MTDAKTVLTSGLHNSVVCDHPQMCHHCGFLVGDVVQCTECGIRAHPSCVTFEEGKCDSCRFGLANEVCAICQCDDPPPSCDTQRLIKCLVLHGFEWESTSESTDDARLHLDREHDVSHTLSQTPNARIHPEDIPHDGSRAMSVELQDGSRMISKPLVVHSWCAQCAFQQWIPPKRPASDPTNAWGSVLDNLCTPVTNEFVVAFTTTKLATSSHNPCVFCGDARGFKAFCFSHMNATCASGCSTCHWRLRPHLSYRCFHPSCAVRSGMRRVVLPSTEGSGMMCNPSSLSFIKQRNPVREKRSFLFESTMFWMEACSGINVPLLMSLDIGTNPGVDYNSVRMGSLHSVPPAPVVPFRPRGKRPRTAARISQETSQDDSNAHQEQDGHNAQRGDQAGNSNDPQHPSNVHAAFDGIRAEMNILRRELMANQETFQRRLLQYVTTEVDKVRQELQRAPLSTSSIVNVEAELKRVQEEIWRRGERELLSFMATLEHLREHS